MKPLDIGYQKLTDILIEMVISCLEHDLIHDKDGIYESVANYRKLADEFKFENSVDGYFLSEFLVNGVCKILETICP